MSMGQSHQILDLNENPLPGDEEQSTVDTTRPFRSVKEAIAIFGDRLQVSETYSPSPKHPFTLPKQESPIWKHTPSSTQIILSKSPNQSDQHQAPSPVVMNTLKKLEFELKETKRELNVLKEREAETEVALASLNAELHKNMSKIAKAEAEVAGKARSSMTMRQVLNGFGEERERRYLYEKKALKKKKPVIPLVTDLFAWKNGIRY
ncbi:hypothetical protein HanRHA438_Chr03g0114561 [Helianthus annuus]|uniref:Uncharacterized protein n=1 Tax=Helianthus annuus TaxID=4232 RepID=A0A9K3JES6_HELAN|nr:uncharacterized protein LOC110931353 [Helianthus annuus]KAF5813858.1 hypothetical protein HanXRQr2_Chr03g0103661 [Helianthus annuus]KAJ0592550.1 hypothetical protein HanHA300_Chr03g0086371 [Helianthus annuus]KAJ0600135.1 hypothetical protein HanIR_Chr03g0113091 [Helianthus annuus]KAJ0607543.1 hypothetical protein HanHA89_Chr03g0097941 [Helianthus annuus]KAJ0767604.1 hypothetical protein HanLR1_Chr03g0091261 [Helianthus annuus]